MTSIPADPAAPSPSFFAILKQTASDWATDNAAKLAAALACYAVLSLAPLIVITFKIISLVLQGPHAESLLTSQLQSLLGPAAGTELVHTILNSSKASSGILATLISLLVLLFAAGGVFGELQDSINTIWRVKPKPGAGWLRWIRTRFLSISMVLGLAFLLLTSFFVSTLITALAKMLLPETQAVAIAIDILLSLALITLMIAVIYKWLPDVYLSWRYVWLGAFVTALLFIAGKWALTLYFQYAAPASAYGAFGSLAAVIIWVYYSSQILFFGAEFTRVYTHAHGHDPKPTEYAVPIDAPSDPKPPRPA